MPYALFFIYGLYAAATEGIAKAWITNLAHESQTATAIGFYTSGESVCALLASILAGFIWSNYGVTPTFALTSVVAVIVIIYLRFMKTLR